MSDRTEIREGESLVTVLQDDNGIVDLTGYTVVLQARVDCGEITTYNAVLSDAVNGTVTVSSIPAGTYQIRHKATSPTGIVTYFPDRYWDTLVVISESACGTFGIFVEDVKATIFPEGEAENLVANHRRYVIDALIDLQQKIPSVRFQHKDRTSQANTFLECHATVLSAPRGFISRVYTITTDGCCPPRDADPIEHDLMLCIIKDNATCGDITVPYNMYLYDGSYVPYPDYGCLYYADASGQTDKTNRPCDRVVSIHNGLLYVFPHLQSNEILVVEWDGIKRSWNDGDEVSFDREVQDAVEHFLAQKVAYREDGDREKMQVELGMYQNLVAKLIWQYRNENRIPKRTHCFSNCDPYAAKRTINGSTVQVPVADCTDPIVDTFSSLRISVDITKCTSVKVLGRDSAFDGFGGIYVRQAQTTPAQADNNADIILSNVSSAYYWKLWQ